ESLLCGTWSQICRTRRGLGRTGRPDDGQEEDDVALTEEIPANEQAGVPDATLFPDSFTRSGRLTILAASAAAGAGGGAILAGAPDAGAAVWRLLGAAAVLGGLLSTWSPCGYSSISLLRPDGRTTLRSVIGW